MKNFLILFKSMPATMEDPQMQEKWGGWFGKLYQDGSVVHTSMLDPHGKYVVGSHHKVEDASMQNGMTTGYMVVKAEDMEHALKIAKECPALADEGKVKVFECQER